MEVESFEDNGVAKLLNDWFVSIKVSDLIAIVINPSYICYFVLALFTEIRLI